MSQGGGEADAARESGGVEDVPGALVAGQLRWHLRTVLVSLATRSQTPLEFPRNRARFVAWWATVAPLLFTSELECLVEESVAALEEPGVSGDALAGLPWLYAASLHIGVGEDPATPLVEGMLHHASAMRAAVHQSLALALPELRFDDRLFQVAVEECIRRQYTDGDDSALVLLASAGDIPAKQRWASSQLVRHVGHSAGLRALLEAASAGHPLPNTLLAPFAQGAIEALAPLAAVAPSLDATSTYPADWPKFDAIRLGGTLWPPLVLNRILGQPFLQAWIALG